MKALDRILFALANNRQPVKTEILKSGKNEQLIKLMRQTKMLYRIQLQTWRDAHQAAIDLDRPSREELMDVYNDAYLDPHLRTVINTRILNVVNIPIEVYDQETLETDEDATALIDHGWAYDTTRLILESDPWGYTGFLWHFKPGTRLPFEVAGVQSFFREHIVPEWNAIRPDISGEEVIDISEPPYNRRYMIIDSGGLGLLLNCSRYTLFKKYAINHWSKYQDKFGIPPLSVTTNIRDKESLDIIEKNLMEFANNLGLVLPEGSELKMHPNTGSDPYQVFLEAAKYADSQNSKIILGQTMTTDDGSSKSQSEVHERTGDNYTKADIRLATNIWNDRIIPFLVNHWGYPLEGKKVRFNTTNKLKKADSQLEIDKWISEKYDIDESYLEETYGTPLLGKIESHQEEPGK